MDTNSKQLEIDFEDLKSNDIMFGDNNMLLSGGAGMCDTITIDSHSWPSSNISMTSANIPSLTISQIGALTAVSNTINTITGSSINLNPGYHSAAIIDQSGTMELNGKNADLKINGVSLMETLRSIQERLNILAPAPELEKDWDQLRKLGKQYRKLQAKFEEKSKMWNTLQSMPPPKIK